MEINHMRTLQQLVRNGRTNFSEFGEVATRIEGDYILFNYNQNCARVNRWNWLESVSRGMILRRSTGEVLARPFDKFFNWFEGGRKSSGHIVSVTEKLDGSMGILWRDSNGYRITTRGSFDNEQGQWATRFWDDNYDDVIVPSELTLIFEIIYPDNRIVVDYGKRESLVLLAARNRFTGRELSLADLNIFANQWAIDLPTYYTFNNPTEILENVAHLTANEEGYVALFSDGQRWKFKGDAYLDLHRLVTNVTYDRAIDAVESGAWDGFIGSVQEESFPLLKYWADHISTRRKYYLYAAQEAIDFIGDTPTRADFARHVMLYKRMHPSMPNLIFAVYDGKSSDKIVYNMIRNEGEPTV